MWPHMISNKCYFYPVIKVWRFSDFRRKQKMYIFYVLGIGEGLKDFSQITSHMVVLSSSESMRYPQLSKWIRKLWSTTQQDSFTHHLSPPLTAWAPKMAAVHLSFALYGLNGIFVASRSVSWPNRAFQQQTHIRFQCSASQLWPFPSHTKKCFLKIL